MILTQALNGNQLFKLIACKPLALFVRGAISLNLPTKIADVSNRSEQL